MNAAGRPLGPAAQVGRTCCAKAVGWAALTHQNRRTGPLPTPNPPAPCRPAQDHKAALTGRRGSFLAMNARRGKRRSPR